MNIPDMKIESRDPQDLSLHPARKALPTLPGWEKDGEQFIALVENIRERGITRPLIVDREGRVLEGEDEWRAAKQLQIAQVPTIIALDGDAYNVILAGGLLRRQLPTKSALAFWAYLLLGPAFEESRNRRIENLKQGRNVPIVETFHSRGKPSKIEDFAEEIGINRHYLFDAKKLYDLFDKHPEPRDIEDEEGETHYGVTFREYYVRRILRGEVRLGAVIAGIAGYLSTSKKKKLTRKQLLLFNQGFDQVAKRWRYWQDLTSEEKSEASAKIDWWVSSMPDEVYAKLKAAIRGREKESKT
jgi:hypothetical protein